MKRIGELQKIFDSPDRYGKGLDWEGYSVNDAANVLRRYLNQLPEPIVPLRFYERARDPLRKHQHEAIGETEAHVQSDAGAFDANAAIASYQQLIKDLPALNRQLLLYILDLLAVFAAKAEINMMPASNLAAIFQPGMLSHPSHDMAPNEYRLSQDVIIFLIENQDHFLVGMDGTAADAQTVKDVQSGVPRQPGTPTRVAQIGLGRSASNASGGADSLRNRGGLRRNVSVSSKNSYGSSNAVTPVSPAPGSPLVATSSGGGVYRSNTVPLKKSPGLNSPRLSKQGTDQEMSTPSKMSTGIPLSPTASKTPSTLDMAHTSAASQAAPGLHTGSIDKSPRLTSVPESSTPRNVSRELNSSDGLSLRTSEHGNFTTITSGAPSKERKSFFSSKSPSSDSERKDRLQPNKLRKKNLVQPPSKNASAQSSTNSLSGGPESPAAPNFYTPMQTPGVTNHPSQDPLTSVPQISNTQASPVAEQPPRLGEFDKLSSFHVSSRGGSPGGSPGLKPARSPVPSLQSKSVAEESDFEHDDETTPKLGDTVIKDGKDKRRSRWRMSSSAKPTNEAKSPAGTRIGSSAIAEQSEASVNSPTRPRKSMTDETRPPVTSGEMPNVPGLVASNNEAPARAQEEGQHFNITGQHARAGEEKEKKGPIGWLRGKLDKREERKAEKERAKSPPRDGSEQHDASKNSLGAIAHNLAGTRSIETPADHRQETATITAAAAPETADATANPTIDASTSD